MGDQGVIEANGLRFEIADTQRQGNAVIHLGVLTDGNLSVGQQVKTRVDPGIRAATARNHTATHLLHAALREVLGEHVMQKGSLVAADRLRFDFSHFESVGQEQLDRIEQRVNGWICANDSAETKVMPLEEARTSGAIALFGENMRIRCGYWPSAGTRRNCAGGTHVTRVGDIGLFKLVPRPGLLPGYAAWLP